MSQPAAVRRISRPLAWCMAFMPLFVHGQLVTEVEIKSGPAATKFDIAHKNYVPPPVASPGWAFIALPANLQPLQASASGVVLLSDNSSYYRWRNGKVDALHPIYKAGSTWVNPANGRNYSANTTSTHMNSLGEIALGFNFNAAWGLAGSNDTYYDSVYWLKHWTPDSTAPQIFNAPQFNFTTLPFNRASLNHVATNLGILKGIDDSGAVWVQIGDNVITMEEYIYGWLDQRLLTKIVRVDPSGAMTGTVFKQTDVGMTYKMDGVSAGGTTIGSITANRVTKYYVGNTEVNFRPTFINKHNWLLGTPLNINSTFVQEPDGTRPPMPADGYVTWIDDQNRLNGGYYPSGSGVFRKAVWIRKEETPIAYERKDYMQLQPPPPWSTNHEVAPGSTSVQLGLMTRPTDTGTETRPFLAVPAAIAVDANRDGTIKLASEDSSDVTSSTSPYRFWLNDDDDFDALNGDDIPNPSSSSDGAATTNFEGDGTVDGLRDLIDFFPVYLDIKQLLTVLPPSASVKYKLKHDDGALNFVYTQLIRADASKYQTQDMGSIFGPSLNQPAPSAGTRRISATGVELSAQFLTGVKDQDWGVILVEGWLPTTKPLVLVVEKDGTTMVEVKLELSISSIESMYRWINLRNVAGQSIARATNTDQPVNYPDSLTNGKMFVLLHGYNVNEDQSRGWGSEAFKRLYWSGSHAMFALVSWHGDHSQIPYIGVAPDYWQNINYAFMTAQALPAAINSLPGSSKVIAGHSMGNVVVSSAIADHGLSVSHYFMLDAAVALEAYDTAAMSVAAMRHPVWASYEPRLWPTEWFNLFPSGDGRRGLTWRNRFGNIANATNFYSSGEDVLNNNDLMPGQVPSVGGERAWVLQEMVKGTNHIGAVLTLDVQGGWGFNSSWDIPTFVPDDSDAGGYYVYTRRTPAQAAALTDEQLSTQTFFLPFQDTRFVSATAGSAAAAEYLPRADALGGAIPALSFATGRNPVPLFEDDLRNVDLMTLEDGWPRTGGRWFHSDAKNIAYRYNYKLWKAWTDLGDLK